MARKILLADDSVTAQNMGRKILADAGYEVVTVNNGSAALKKIAETKPDLIVLDVYMPGYSGLEVCQRLKEVQETSRIPILLTVGKLEPFKPEEAKRVRAEGFIVKPFEASELLAALTKLEDKIVPRAEASKPGRFARANAALDEGRYDKTVAIDEDSGWKNRINFPHKKKKAVEEEEDGDDPAIYNAINKDLRTTVDHKPAHVPQAVQPEESRVDLGALVPEGLPKDVTPEEIAALAAAAAQVKARIEESSQEGAKERFQESSRESAAAHRVPEPVPTPVAEAKSPESPIAEVKVPEVQAAEASAPVIEAAAAKAEDKAEDKAEAKPELSVESPKESAAEPVATFAEQKSEAPAEVAAETFTDIPRVSSEVAPSPADVMAAISALESETGKSPEKTSGYGFGSHAAPEHRADEPVTMAVAAGAESSPSVSRWTAVAVALAPEESTISLEQEMQKAHAAFAAAEAARAEAIAEKPEIPSATAEPAPAIETISPVEAITPELVGPVSTAPETEIAQTAPQIEAQSESRSENKTEPPSDTIVPSMGAVAVAGTEAVTAAVREFERVAASHLEAQQPQSAAQPEPAPEQVAETTPDPAPEASPAVEAKVEEPAFASSLSEPEPLHPEPATLEALNSEAAHDDSPEPVREEKIEAPAPEPKYEQEEKPKTEDPAPVVAASASSETAYEASSLSAEPPQPESASVNEASANEVSEGHGSASRDSSTPTDSAVASQPAVGSARDSSKKESEIAETTAAAWASWRRIREAGDAKSAPAQHATPKQETEEELTPQDKAVMAVAAGAEKAPAEVPPASEDTGDIANIVDSVLADMRPKIVAEISKKLGKKK